MADRFPSLDELDQGQTDVKPNTVAAASNLDAEPEDPSDFLARERAALGDDADLFAAPSQSATAATIQGDLLGDDDDDDDDGSNASNAILNQQQYDSSVFASSAAHTVPIMNNDTAAFESSFPAIQRETANEQVVLGGRITGPTTTSIQPTFSDYQQQPELEESEAVKEWREKRNAELARRAETSAEKKAQTIAKAQADIDDYYESYNNRADKARQRTRKEAEEFLEKREDTAVGGTAWERIAKLVDVSGKGAKGGANGSGKERFRQILLDLKKDEKAPGASGV
ncbi:hypothetical protein KEM54_001702 [Ascosphaera aggregata]|nr:hypothetical protein KEM54_001702 [Ascosphaera aggregata]